ncbi:hypothetical protein AAG906_035657 [Vitis piasezkii]
MKLKSGDKSKFVLMVGICGLGGVGKSTMVKLFIMNSLINLRNMLCREKVLLVIDGANDETQLQNLAGGHDWFGEGSRIFITSRNKELLVQHKVDVLYELPELNNDEALELFSWHAFETSYPHHDFYILSKKFVEYCQGLPLALKILGSCLFQKQSHEWKIQLRDLDKEPNMKILDVLKVGMHNLIQRLGHKIVRDEGPRNKGMRSRLWDHVDVKDVLKKRTGTNSIEGIFLNLSKLNNINLTTQAMKEMSGLRLLKIFLGSEVVSGEEDYKVRISRDFEFPTWGLSYLYWHGYPLNSLPSNFEPDKLVELNMPYSNIREFVEGIWYIDPSIGDLRRLSLLDLKECKSLGSLPDSICNLKSLKTLYLSGCSELNCLPEDLGNMQHLTELYANRTATGAPPPVIGRLRELQILSFSGCTGGRAYPSLFSLSELSMLKVLVLGRCKRLEEIPEFPPSLEELDAHECASCKLPWLHQDMLWKDHAPKSEFCILIPGDGIPEWFEHREMGSLLTMELPSDWYDRDKFLGFCVCFVFAFKDQLPQIHDDILCHGEHSSNHHHMWMAYQPRSGVDICHPEAWNSIRASFELSGVTDALSIKCGIHLIYK